MGIVERKKNELATLDLSPQSFRITILKNASNELDYLRSELNKLDEVKQHNISLALKLKEWKGKYQQEKLEHNNTRKMMQQYYEADRELNIKLIFCPFLQKEINLVQCQKSVSFGYCTAKHHCVERKEAILNHFNLGEKDD